MWGVGDICKYLNPSSHLHTVVLVTSFHQLKQVWSFVRQRKVPQLANKVAKHRKHSKDGVVVRSKWEISSFLQVEGY